MLENLRYHFYYNRDLYLILALIVGMSVAVAWLGSNAAAARRAEQREICHTLYAQARTHSDTIVVNQAKPYSDHRICYFYNQPAEK